MILKIAEDGLVDFCGLPDAEILSEISDFKLGVGVISGFDICNIMNT